MLGGGVGGMCGVYTPSHIGSLPQQHQHYAHTLLNKYPGSVPDDESFLQDLILISITVIANFIIKLSKESKTKYHLLVAR